MAKIASDALVERLGVCLATSGPRGDPPTARLHADLAECSLVVDNPAQQPHKAEIATTLFKGKIEQLGR
jgi:hypothetical protein